MTLASDIHAGKIRGCLNPRGVIYTCGRAKVGQLNLADW